MSNFWPVLDAVIGAQEQIVAAPAYVSADPKVQDAALSILEATALYREAVTESIAIRTAGLELS